MDLAKEPRLLLPGSSLPPVVGATPAPGLVKDKVIEVSVWIRRKASAPPLPVLDETGEQPIAKRAPAIDRAEFSRRWGADQADVDAVLAYMKPFGIRPVGEKGDLPNALARRLVALSGKLVDFERAFGVTVALFSLPGFPPFIVRTGAVHIPVELKGIVLGVSGWTSGRSAWTYRWRRRLRSRRQRRHRSGNSTAFPRWARPRDSALP